MLDSVLLVLPERANAWWDIIEELSGPGRFYGWDIDLRLFCLNDKVDATRAGDRTHPRPREVGPTVGSRRLSVPGQEEAMPVAMAVNLGARFLKADDNSQFANGQRISLTTLEPSISVQPSEQAPDRDFLDYGFGAGVYWFSSTEFPSFNGAFLEPVRFEFHTTTAYETEP